VTSIEKFYFKELQKSIHVLENQSSFDLRGIPVIISGMASSVIGIREVPYASLPFALDGSEARVEYIPPSNGFPYKIYLISGVSSSADVMRGEETQIVGLASIYKDIYEAEDTVCILPGTHSKHIRLHKKTITDFRTYITGELFNVMAHHSMLKDAVSDKESSAALNESQMNSFCRGINGAKRSNLLHTLFTVRINQLFKLLEKEENLYYLSGLLIGTELSEVSENIGGRIVLCSGSNVYDLYKLAIQEMDMQSRTELVGAEIMDKVVIQGHIAILKHQ
jgi:2-dehydro-3-deoxygalactonokinase